MKKLIASFAMVTMALITSAQAASIAVDVVASSGPNGYYNSSWSGYEANALYALENELSTYGDRATNPTGYEAAPAVVGPWEIAVTSFNSWRGDVNPTGAFADEHGNRMHFGIHIYGDGDLASQFTLEDLSFEIHSSDAGDTMVHTGNFVGATYKSSRYGIDWGVDRAKGGGDDTIYTSGNGTTLVDELVYVGVGNAWWPGGDDPTPSTPAGGAQAAMDDHYSWITSTQPITVTGTYAITTNAGVFSGYDMVTVVPEPMTWTMLVLGAFGLMVISRLRRK